MNALITLSVLAILVLYLGLYKAKNALLPVTLFGLGAALVLSILDSGLVELYTNQVQLCYTADTRTPVSHQIIPTTHLRLMQPIGLY